jgi:hypothetical protein
MIIFMTKFKRSSHNNNSFPGYAPAPEHRHFRDKLSEMETVEYTAYSGALVL